MASLLAGIAPVQPVDLGASFRSGQSAAMDMQRQGLQLQGDQQTAALKTAEIIGRFAVDADTPEKWAAGMQAAAALGVPDAAQYAGQFDKREQIIRATQAVSDQLKARTAGRFIGSLNGQDVGVGMLGTLPAPRGSLGTLPAAPGMTGAAPPVGNIQTTPLAPQSAPLGTGAAVDNLMAGVNSASGSAQSAAPPSIYGGPLPQGGTLASLGRPPMQGQQPIGYGAGSSGTPSFGGSGLTAASGGNGMPPILSGPMNRPPYPMTASTVEADPYFGGIANSLMGRQAPASAPQAAAGQQPIGYDTLDSRLPEFARTGRGVQQPVALSGDAGATNLRGSAGTDTLRPTLARSESGGNPGIVNAQGYSGTYQMGEGALADAGVYRDATPGVRNDWSGEFNIPGFPEVRTQADFLANPAAQEAAFNLHVSRLEQEMNQAGLGQYIGQTVGGVPITEDGLIMMAHLGGVGGTKRFLESGGRNDPADANGTHLSDYARRAAGVGGSGGGTVRSSTRDIQPPAPNGVPLSALAVLAADPSYADTAVSSAINQFATPKDTTVWARLDDGHVFNQRTGDVVAVPGGTDIKPTDDIREYLYAKQQDPNIGTFEQWQLKNKRAGAMSMFPDESPETLGDKKFYEGMGTKEAESYNNILEGGRTAQITQGDLNTLDAALQNVPTGGLSPMAATFANYAASLGLDVQNEAQLGGTQAIQAIVARIAPRLRVPGAGTTSDRDLQLFMDSLPNLANTEEGNRLIIQTLRAFSQRSVQEAQIVNDGVAAGLPRSQIRKNLLALGPVISPEQAKTMFAPAARLNGALPQFNPNAAPAPAAGPAGEPPTVRNDADYNALPPGREYIAPDGSRRRKQ